MAKRRLVVPGTGGVLFEDSAGKQVGSVFDLITRPEKRALLQCLHDKEQHVLAPTATSGKAGVSLEAKGHMSLAYALMDQATARWTFWDYDWRLDIRYSGGKLARFLKEKAADGDPWHIVCHSQGGLVLLWAARVLGQDAFARLVDSVVFVGVPFFGTFNALEALTNGYFIRESIPAHVARTWPSLYQMLPQWGVAGAHEPDGQIFLNETWHAAGLFPPNPDDINLNQHIDPYLLERAREMYKTTQVYSFTALAKLKFVRIILGLGEPTKIAVSRFPHMTPASFQDGDSLVPNELTYQLLPNWIREEASIKRFVAGTHSSLCSDQNVYDWCI